MSERELGQAMLRSEKRVDSQALTDGVLRRDRRRLWLLGIACVIAWMIVVMLPWATVLPLLAKIAEHRTEFITPNTPQPGEQTLFMIQVRQAVIVTFVCSIISMFLAAICTVSLILFSRRATMRQVSIQLAEISSQIKMLGQAK